jgi:adenylate cyclase
MDFRVGVHMGDVATEGGRIYGDGANIAARLEALAEAGGVCISATVHEQVRNKLDAGFTDLGEQTLKNIPDQVRVYRIHPEGQSHRPARVATASGKEPRRLRRALIAVGSLLLLLGVGLWASWPRPLGFLIDVAGLNDAIVEPALPEKPSIVVLPFENLSGDPEQEYFSDGITDELTNALASNPFLFVISRNSAFTYKGKRVNVKDVGRELGVQYVLEGGVRKAEDRVRISARLVDASAGGNLWTERYERDLIDVFALQTEIAEDVAAEVGGEIFRAEGQRVVRKPISNLSAYEAIHKGNVHLFRNTVEDNQLARKLFERAVELDPEFAAAYASLAVTYWVEYASGWNRDPALLDRSEEIARRAIALDRAWPHSYAPLAWVALLRGDFDEALTAAERTIELAPSFVMGHAIRGMALAQQGRLVDAIGSIRQAMRLSPRAANPGMLVAVARVNFAAGRRQEALRFMDRAREAVPDNLAVRVALAAMYGLEDAPERVRAEVAEMLRVKSDFTLDGAMELLAGIDQTMSPDELAKLPDLFRAAGLPSG